MKKFLAIVLVLALLAGCAYLVFDYFDSRPNIGDLEKTKENLEAAGYTVMLITAEDKIGYLPDGAVKYLSASDKDDNTLVIYVYENRELAKLKYEQLKCSLEYQIESIELQIEQLEYDLENNEDLTDDEIKLIEKRIDTYEEALEQFKSYKVGRSGKTIWYGTKDAAKASRG